MRTSSSVEVVLAGRISPANVGRLLAQLPLHTGRVSVHAYSGAQIGGQTTVEAVRELVVAVQRASPGALANVRNPQSAVPAEAQRWPLKWLSRMPNPCTETIVSDSQSPSQGADAPHPGRLYFLDNLRATVIVLVVVLHTFLTYIVYAPPWWYVLDPVRNVLFDWAVILIDVPLMPVLFFLAGFFALPSLERHGPGNFMRDKVARIGIPWVVGVLFLAPLVTYMIYVSRQIPVSYGQFWATEFWGPMYQQAVYWFLGVLFLFYALLSAGFDGSTRLRAWRRVTRAPSWWHFLVFGAIMTAAFFLLSLWWTPDDWRHVWLIVYQPVQFPLYIGYFCFGLYADRRGWFAPGGYKPNIDRWLPLFLVAGLLYAGHIALQLFGPARDAMASGGHSRVVQCLLSDGLDGRSQPVPDFRQQPRPELAQPGPELVWHLLPASVDPLPAGLPVRGASSANLPQGSRADRADAPGLLGLERVCADARAGAAPGLWTRFGCPARSTWPAASR